MTHASFMPPQGILESNTEAQEKTCNKQKNRVQLDLTPRAMRLLNDLKEKTDSTSNAEVIRDALKLYDGLITEVERGSDFLIRDKTGNISAFKVFL